MAITKQYLKSKPECKVTFVVPAEEAETVAVAGDFNDWEKTALKKLKNGTFKGTVNVPVGESYEFRYLVDDQWANETQADGTKWNEFANAENSVLAV